MIIPLKDIKDNIPYEFNFDYPLNLSNHLNLEKKTAVLKISGSISKQGNLYICDITAKTLLLARCDFCLISVPYDIDYVLTEHFSKSNDASDGEEIHAITTEDIDLTDVVLAGLYSQMPSQFICRDTCKGLCTSCGNNLNINKCNCHENEDDTDPRFDALKNIKWR